MHLFNFILRVNPWTKSKFLKKLTVKRINQDTVDWIADYQFEFWQVQPAVQQYDRIVNIINNIMELNT